MPHIIFSTLTDCAQHSDDDGLPPQTVGSGDRTGQAQYLQVFDQSMTDTVDNLVLDLLEWLGTIPRPYDEVLEAWRTSCPGLPVWEEANVRGYIERHHATGLGQVVSVSKAGADHLRTYRRQARGAK